MLGQDLRPLPTADLTSRVAIGHCTIVRSLCIGVCPFGSRVGGPRGTARPHSGHRIWARDQGRPPRPMLGSSHISRGWARLSPLAAYVETRSLWKLLKCVGYVVAGPSRALWNPEPAHPAPGLRGHFPEDCWALSDCCRCRRSHRPPEVVAGDCGCSGQRCGLTEWICGPAGSLAAYAGLADARCLRALLEFLWERNRLPMRAWGQSRAGLEG